LKDLKYAINEMFARYGTDFVLDERLTHYFEKFLWYHPQPGRDNIEAFKLFTPLERENLLLLSYFRDLWSASTPSDLTRQDHANQGRLVPHPTGPRTRPHY
jgi:hypothetical protein